jgi:hypothetical protein
MILKGAGLNGLLDDADGAVFATGVTGFRGMPLGRLALAIGRE